MQPHYLLTLGDSWPAGEELSDPSESFPVLIAKYLDVELLNLSDPGSSADQALYRLLNVTNIQWDKTLVLFCLSGMSRSMYINDEPQGLHPAATNPQATAYYKFIHSSKLDHFNRIRNILSAQQCCQTQGGQVLFVNNYDNTPKHSAIDQSLFYNKTLIEILNIQHFGDVKVDWRNFRKHDYITPNMYHPNATGHGVIAKTLGNWIKEKLNDKSL